MFAALRGDGYKQPQGLECHWRISRTTYPGSKGKFRWQILEEVCGTAHCGLTPTAWLI